MDEHLQSQLPTNLALCRIAGEGKLDELKLAVSRGSSLIEADIHGNTRKQQQPGEHAVVLCSPVPRCLVRATGVLRVHAGAYAHDRRKHEEQRRQHSIARQSALRRPLSSRPPVTCLTCPTPCGHSLRLRGGTCPSWKN